MKKSHWMYKIFSRSLLSIILISVGTMVGCSHSDSSDSEEPKHEATKGQLVGRINSNNNITNAEITVGSKSARANEQGYFVIEAIDIPSSNRWLVNVKKPGFVDTQAIVELGSTETNYSIEIFLTEPDITQILDLTQEQTVTFNQDQISISLPANSVRGGGENSKVSLTYGDPSSISGKAIFPGDFSATNELDSPSNIILESIGFVDVSVSSEEGNDLTVLTEPAEITLRLPDIYQLGGRKSLEYTTGDTIPWWSYNEENGTWLREDADPSTDILDDANILTNNQGVVFAKAKITHFSWWNVDQPIDEHACVTVQVVNKNGTPFPDIPVTAEGISYQFSDTSVTDSDGFASLTVKRSIANTETFKLYSEIGPIKYSYDVTSITEGNIDNDILNSPSERGSTIGVKSGTCQDLDILSN